MKKLGKKSKGMKDSMGVARGCYCGALCSCYGASSTSASYTAVEAAGWMTSEVIS